MLWLGCVQKCCTRMLQQLRPLEGPHQPSDASSFRQVIAGTGFCTAAGSGADLPPAPAQLRRDSTKPQASHAGHTHTMP